MTGSFGELGSLLKQAQEMQRALDKVRAEMKTRTVEGSAGGGAVRVWVTGDRQVSKLEISEEFAKAASKQELEELILLALRDGIGKATRMAEEACAKVTGGVNLPGLF
ncbi:MAG: YbaB/EbfC family nucleoid-associated protein [Planctomycetes bacterium]|nr:YbaB/EbfC family nucleoid-associated protein [Planctomycetota bacterium]